MWMDGWTVLCAFLFKRLVFTSIVLCSYSSYWMKIIFLCFDKIAHSMDGYWSAGKLDGWMSDPNLKVYPGQFI